MDKIKATIVGVFALINGILGTLAIPMYILVLLNTIDYITGMICAPYRNQALNSYRGFKGIAKKVCMWLLVVVGVIIDWLIIYGAENAGIVIDIEFLVASLVAVWLISNEIISILENLTDIGVPMPKFLMTIVEKIKGSSDVDVK